MTTPQGAHVDVEGRGELLNLCANNYLGLANHPDVVAAAHEALDRWGFGMASVRFICGTQIQHEELERRLSEFLGTEATILFGSCFDANGGLFEALLDRGGRGHLRPAEPRLDHRRHPALQGAAPAVRERRHGRAAARLEDASRRRRRLIATDGVFSMDGYLAKLDEICDLAERHDALVMVDDSHAVGVVGPGGRGTPERYGVIDRVDIVTGTLGKAVGGASGGYISARAEIVDLLRQRARPYLFSNSLAPPVVAASLAALDLIESSAELRDRLRDNTAHFRARMTELGFEILPGEHPIVPVMIGDEVTAAAFAARLAELGVYAVSFSFPVVPRGTARIRTQMSAAHTTEDLDFAASRFAEAREAVPV